MCTHEELQDLLELTPPKDNVLFIKVNWNAKGGSQQILGVTGKCDLVIQIATRQSLTEFCEENTLVIANTLIQQYNR